MNQISGLPAHPLLVHIPVALLPLAALGTVVILARAAWYERYRWAVLVVAGIGTLGAILAASSGESLEHQMRDLEGAARVQELHDHVAAGEMARTMAIVFFAVLATYVVVPWFIERRSARAEQSISHPGWVRPVLMVLVAISAAVSMISIIDAGHSGASRAWEEYNTSSAVVHG